MHADRLLLTGSLMAPRPRQVRRAQGWLLSAFAAGGAIGLAYHVIAPALVSSLQRALLWIY